MPWVQSQGTDLLVPNVPIPWQEIWRSEALSRRWSVASLESIVPKDFSLVGLVTYHFVEKSWKKCRGIRGVKNKSYLSSKTIPHHTRSPCSDLERTSTLPEQRFSMVLLSPMAAAALAVAAREINAAGSSP